MEKQFIPITPIGVEKEALKMTVLNGQPEIFHLIAFKVKDETLVKTWYSVD